MIFELLPSPFSSVMLGIANVPDSEKQCINPDVDTETQHCKPWLQLELSQMIIVH